MSLVLIATGGTIASTVGADGLATATLSGGDLLSRLPVGAAAGVEVVDVRTAGSWNLGTTGALAVAAEVRRAVDAGATGVVVTHGTDVMEETAWVLELVLQDPGVPVVLTGSMQHADALDYDGVANLTDALLVARSDGAASRRVSVCMHGEVHQARWVTKLHATDVGTFASPQQTPVGRLYDAEASGTPSRGVEWVAAAPPCPPQVGAQASANVPIVVSHWDADPSLVPWHLERGAQGIVVEAGGAGNVNDRLVPGLLEAVRNGIPVVVASRCRWGRVTPIYGGVGGFGSLESAGCVASGGLTAGKARVALQLLLSAVPDSGHAVDASAQWFAALASST
ncbi:MAG: asparaginase [Actinomycetes bacterium]